MNNTPRMVLDALPLVDFLLGAKSSALQHLRIFLKKETLPFCSRFHKKNHKKLTTFGKIATAREAL